MSLHLTELLNLIKRLRSEDDGCAWTREQSYDSIVPYTIEEAYEVAEAIEAQDYDELKHELGDLLLQVVFYAQFAEEEGRFNFDDVAKTVIDKHHQRMPEYFDDQAQKTAEAVNQRWETEKLHSLYQEYGSVLGGIAKSLPAMTRAVKLQNRAALIGFDWPDVKPVLQKLKEEISELEHELENAGPDEHIAEEYGDILFCVTNLARHLKLDPEGSLRQANSKFMRRFQALEDELKQEDQNPLDLDLDALEAVWQQVKGREKKR